MQLDNRFKIADPSRAVRVAQARAAKRLWGLGLVEYLKQVRGERRIHIYLTDLGAQVVERYRHELENGLRIRWPKSEEN